MDKYKELKDNLIELYNYAKKYYYEDRALTQKEKKLLVKWSHVILKTSNSLTSVYDYDTTIEIELHAMFLSIYTSVTPIPISYQATHEISVPLSHKLDNKEISIIKSFLKKIEIFDLEEDPRLNIENLEL